MGPPRGIVLGHDVDVGILGDLFGDEPEDFLRPGEAVREDQVAHDEATGCNAVLHHEISHLAVHLAQGLFCDFEVTRRRGVLFRHFRIPVLEIRHVDIHYPFKDPQHLHRLIPTTIPNYRQFQPVIPGHDQCPNDGMGLVGGRDEVHVVTADQLQL